MFEKVLPCRVCDVLNLLSQAGTLRAMGSWLREPITLLPDASSLIGDVGSKPGATSRAQQVNAVIPARSTGVKGDFEPPAIVNIFTERLKQLDSPLMEST